MKIKFYTYVVLLAVTFAGIAPAMGQVTETVSIGSANEVYYSLSTGTQSAVNRKQWDIAFRANRRSASIITNDASGVELYAYPKTDTSGWAAAADTSGLYGWKKLVNSTTDWETGAFCQNQKGHPDYGWGTYNSTTHDVMGDSIFIIKLRDGSFRKLWIMEKFSADNVFQFKYANLDGTGENNILFDCNPYATKNFIGYSLSTNQGVDFEPVISTNWDLLFTKYVYTYPVSGAQQTVTGVLSNYKVKVKKYEPVTPDFLMLAPQVMDSTRSPIGFDWKTYNYDTGVYDITDSLIYFVQDKSGKIFKLIFTEYVGGSTGRFGFQKELNSFTGVTETSKSGFNATVYPNPVSNVMNLMVNPGKSRFAVVSIVDMSGRTVLSKHYDMQSEDLSTLKIPVSEIPSGLYMVKIQAGGNTIARKVIVNN